MKLLEIIIETWVLPGEGGDHVPSVGGVLQPSGKDTSILQTGIFHEMLWSYLYVHVWW